MPAIDLTKLKNQSSHLITLFDQPEAFLHELEKILESYRNRTLRSNTVPIKSNLNSYQTPSPVIHQIEKDLEKLGEENPSAAVNLVLALWNASYYEAQMLAAFVLGTIPTTSALTILSGLPEWLHETSDPNVKKALLTTAMARLRKENPRVLLLLITDWLQSPGPKTQTWGLHAFVPLIELLGYDDLPQLFEILRPAIESVSPSTQSDIQACLEILYSISPSETKHYLAEIIQKAEEKKQLVKYQRLFRNLSPEMQTELGQILRKVTSITH